MTLQLGEVMQEYVVFCVDGIIAVQVGINLVVQGLLRSRVKISFPSCQMC